MRLEIAETIETAQGQLCYFYTDPKYPLTPNITDPKYLLT